jgi:hypothetical protein
VRRERKRGERSAQGKELKGSARRRRSAKLHDLLEDVGGSDAMALGGQANRFCAVQVGAA